MIDEDMSCLVLYFIFKLYGSKSELGTQLVFSMVHLYSASLFLMDVLHTS
jgi:hypothetical protein